MLAAVRGYAREVMVHHVQVDDDGGCFEFRDEHDGILATAQLDRICKIVQDLQDYLANRETSCKSCPDHGTISNGASCFVDLRITMSVTSIIAG